jgi:hypothetical protein
VSRRNTLIVIAAAMVALVTATWHVNAAWNDRTAAVHALNRMRSNVGDTTARLATAQARLRQDHVEARRVRAIRDAAQVSLDLRKVQLASTTTDRDHSAQVRDAKNAEVLVVQECLDGAGRALDALERHDAAATTAALQSVDTACRAAQGGDAGPTPEYGFDFPDPYVLTVGTDQYAFGTNASGGTIQMLARQADGSWTTKGDALGRFPDWAGWGRTWAPAVLARPGGYVMYYTVRETSSGRQCISRAVATTPTGPYIDTSTGPLECGERDAIDPEPILQTDGTPILLWVHEHPNTIMARPLATDGLSFIGATHQLLAPTVGWEANNVEAPSMLVTPGGAWLFFSANDWNSRHYAIGVVHCATPLGPCDHAGPSPLMSSHDTIVGPGGGSVYQATPGDYHLAFHAYREPNIGYPASRLLFTTTIELTNGRPTLTG